MKTLLSLALVALMLTGCATNEVTSGEYGPRGGNYPYALKAKGKPGFVISPFNKSALIDVRGFPRGTQVTDPWTDQIFLVP